MSEPSLHDRLVARSPSRRVDRFSDAVVRNPIVGPAVGEPGLTGVAHRQPWPAARPQVHADALGLRGGRRAVRVLRRPGRGRPPWASRRRIAPLRISPAEFDEVVADLARTLALFKVPEREKAEVLGAKGEVTEGYLAAVSR